MNISLEALGNSLTPCNGAPPAKSKMANGVWKGVYPKVFGRSKQLSLNNFFDPSTPSMRKDDGEEEKMGGGERKENSVFYSGH